jgi:two-component system chemotaxis response regulator CheB
MQVTMDRDAFRLSPLVKTPGWPKNISIFLKSLADDRQKRAIAVILSGFDSDGAAALESIKEAAGARVCSKVRDGQAAGHAEKCFQDRMR